MRYWIDSARAWFGVSPVAMTGALWGQAGTLTADEVYALLVLFLGRPVVVPLPPPVVNPTTVAVNWRGAWDVAVNYVRADVVSYQGSSWVALRATVGDAPAVSVADWALLAAGSVGEDGPAGDAGPAGPAGTDTNRCIAEYRSNVDPAPLAVPASTWTDIPNFTFEVPFGTKPVKYLFGFPYHFISAGSGAPWGIAFRFKDMTAGVGVGGRLASITALNTGSPVAETGGFADRGVATGIPGPVDGEFREVRLQVLVTAAVTLKLSCLNAVGLPGEKADAYMEAYEK